MNEKLALSMHNSMNQDRRKLTRQANNIGQELPIRKQSVPSTTAKPNNNEAQHQTKSLRDLMTPQRTLKESVLKKSHGKLLPKGSFTDSGFLNGKFDTIRSNLARNHTMIDQLTSISPEPNVETDNTYKKAERPNTTVSSFVIGEDEIVQPLTQQKIQSKTPQVVIESMEQTDERDGPLEAKITAKGVAAKQTLKSQKQQSLQNRNRQGGINKKPPNPSQMNYSSTLKATSKTKGKQRLRQSGVRVDQLVHSRQSNISDLSESIRSQISSSYTDPKKRSVNHQTVKQIGKHRPVFELPYKQDPYKSVPKQGLESKEEEESQNTSAKWNLTAEIGKSDHNSLRNSKYAGSQGTCDLSENSSFNQGTRQPQLTERRNFTKEKSQGFLTDRNSLVKTSKIHIYNKKVKEKSPRIAFESDSKHDDADVASSFSDAPAPAGTNRSQALQAILQKQSKTNQRGNQSPFHYDRQWSRRTVVEGGTNMKSFLNAISISQPRLIEKIANEQKMRANSLKQQDQAISLKSGFQYIGKILRVNQKKAKEEEPPRIEMNVVYKPPEFQIEYFKQNFISIKRPVRDRFRLCPFPYDQMMVASNLGHLRSFHNQSPDKEGGDAFMDQMLQLDIGWAVLNHTHKKRPSNSLKYKRKNYNSAIRSTNQLRIKKETTEPKTAVIPYRTGSALKIQQEPKQQQSSFQTVNLQDKLNPKFDWPPAVGLPNEQPTKIDDQHHDSVETPNSKITKSKSATPYSAQHYRMVTDESHMKPQETNEINSSRPKIYQEVFVNNFVESTISSPLLASSKRASEARAEEIQENEDSVSLKEKLQLEQQQYRLHHSHANHLKQSIRISQASVARLSEFQAQTSKSRIDPEMPFNSAIEDQNEYQLRIIDQAQNVPREQVTEEANNISEFDIPRLDGYSENQSSFTGRVERIYSHKLDHTSSRSKEPTLRDLLSNPKTSKSSNAINPIRSLTKSTQGKYPLPSGKQRQQPSQAKTHRNTIGNKNKPVQGATANSLNHQRASDSLLDRYKPKNVITDRSSVNNSDLNPYNNSLRTHEQVRQHSERNKEANSSNMSHFKNLAVSQRKSYF